MDAGRLPAGPARSVVGRVGVIWLAGSAVGLALLVPPDDDDRIVSLSDAHGPSSLDLAGVAVAVLAWLPVLVLLCRHWPFRGAGAWAAAGVAVAAAAALAVTLQQDGGVGWVGPVVVLLGVQVLALGTLWTRASRTGPRPR